jgi:hypothetical protein
MADVAFGATNSTAATGAPTGAEVTLDIAQASYTKAFSLVPGTRHVLVSYGFTAVSDYTFRCGLVPFTSNGQLGTVLTLIE